MRRFQVVEDSMLPVLVPGQEVVATDSRTAMIGDLVVFEHPDRPGFWLVKRKVEPYHPLGEGEAWVLSENDSKSTVDSRAFGPIDDEILRPVVQRLDESTFAEACHLLAAEDAALGALLSAHGMPPFWRRPEGFPTLVLLILEQQVSLESGAAVYRRLVKATGGVTPGSVGGLGIADLRELGITRQKAGYLVDLANAVADGSLDFDSLASAPPQRAKASLMEIRGIGAWTADAYLLSALRHIDVFPVGDRALQVATGEALGMTTTPDPGELEILSAPWRPVRAAAARLLWNAYLTVRGRTEPDDVPLRAD